MKDIKEQIKNSKIVLRDIDDLIPYAKNSRKHSAEQIDKIAASIKHYGFTNPVLIKSSGDVLAGHGRILGAKKLKLKQVPCIELDLNDVDAKSYILADNQLATLSEWDDELLKSELMELHESDFDLELIGFDEDFLFGKEDNEEPKEFIDTKELLVVVTCQDEREQREVFDKLNNEGYKCKLIG